MRPFAIKLDENLGRTHVQMLRDAGYDADRLHDEGLSGANDARVWQAVCEEDRLLITLDLDFSDVRKYPPGTHPGILLLRHTITVVMPSWLFSPASSRSRHWRTSVAAWRFRIRSTLVFAGRPRDAATEQTGHEYHHWQIALRNYYGLLRATGPFVPAPAAALPTLP